MKSKHRHKTNVPQTTKSTDAGTPLRPRPRLRCPRHCSAAGRARWSRSGRAWATARSSRCPQGSFYLSPLYLSTFGALSPSPRLPLFIVASANPTLPPCLLFFSFFLSFAVCVIYSSLLLPSLLAVAGPPRPTLLSLCRVLWSRFAQTPSCPFFFFCFLFFLFLFFVPLLICMFLGLVHVPLQAHTTTISPVAFQFKPALP